MERKEVLEKLCYYDDRNPNWYFATLFDLWIYDEEEIENEKKEIEERWYCSCDNCFYNRTPLAEELLKFIT